MSELTMFAPDVPKADLTWSKVPNVDKWIGRLGRKHVASVVKHETSGYRVWLLGADGWRELLNPDAYGFVGYPATAKDVAAVALAELMRREVGL